MKTTSLTLYSLNYRELKTYLATTAFVAGNIVLPQFLHLIPNGGTTFLPIYFFTLIAAYKYGWKVGMLTAILSPLFNYLLFGMPSSGMLPAILIKSILLASIAGVAANYFKRISIPIFFGVVLSYQIIGTVGEWALTGNFFIAMQDFRIAIPGMLLQIFGGFALLRYIIYK